MSFSQASVVCAMSLFLLPAVARSQVVEKQNEEFLRTNLKLKTDNDSLLSLLKKRAECQNPDDLDRLIRRLGSGSYQERELAGRMLFQFGPELSVESQFLCSQT